MLINSPPRTIPPLRFPVRFQVFVDLSINSPPLQEDASWKFANSRTKDENMRDKNTPGIRGGERLNKRGRPRLKSGDLGFQTTPASVHEAFTRTVKTAILVQSRKNHEAFSRNSQKSAPKHMKSHGNLVHPTILQTQIGCIFL